MIEKIIKKAFDLAILREWNKTYWAIDIHETLIKPSYSRDEIPTEWYPLALKALKLISDRADICLILFTCSHPEEIEKYLEFFKLSNINFEYVNKNPEVKTQENGYGYYEDKMYINVLMDDKAGFNPYNDWKYVIAALENKSQLFNPIDWGFVFTENYNYEYYTENDTILRISPNFDTDYIKFEAITDSYYDVRYKGDISSMRQGDNIIKTVFKEFNLTDKTYL